MKKLMNKKMVWIVLIIIAISSGYLIYRSKETPKPVYQEVKIENGDLTISILSTGTVQPENRLQIKPPISGRIDKVLIKEGQKVAKGQILAWMSSTERAALLDAARSQDLDEVKKWEDLYRPTPILAPLSGTIILRSIESGQTVMNTDAILVMSDRLIVKAQVDETDMAQVALKQRADLVLDAYSSEKIPAKVDSIAYEAKTTNNVTTYDIDVLPETTPAYMRAGMTANVTFYVDSRSNVLLVPSEALTYQGKQASVLVKALNSRDEPVLRSIKLGLSDGKQTEVLEGLSAGETVLISKITTGEFKKPANPFGGPSMRGKKK